MSSEKVEHLYLLKVMSIWLFLCYGDKMSYSYSVGPRTTDAPHPGASTLFSAPRSKQLGHQGRYTINV